MSAEVKKGWVWGHRCVWVCFVYAYNQTQWINEKPQKVQELIYYKFYFALLNFSQTFHSRWPNRLYQTHSPSFWSDEKYFLCIRNKSVFFVLLRNWSADSLRECVFVRACVRACICFWNGVGSNILCVLSSIFRLFKMDRTAQQIVKVIAPKWSKVQEHYRKLFVL